MSGNPLKELQNIPILIHPNRTKDDKSTYPNKTEFLSNGLLGTKVAPSSLEVVNVGYGNGQDKENGVHTSETPVVPKTPLKNSGEPPKTGTPPLTPLANLKVLMAAASTALEKESGQQQEMGKAVEGVSLVEGEKPVKEIVTGEDVGGRKMKSLAILCKRFLSIAEEIGEGTDFSLESMSKKLGTNRRRIYDIINVLEALEMIVKQSKNWYTWLGQKNLLVTLAKMRAMAEDDIDFRGLLDKENSQETHPPPSLQAPASLSTGPEGGVETGLKMEDTAFSNGAEDGGSLSGGRWDKSLGVLCQKFIMLFLVTPENEVTLDFAGNILMPDEGSFSPQPTNPKTKVRRLYDIANVLTTLGLIRKKTFLAPNHRKMPGYSWAGPSLNEIQTIPVFRKTEFNLYPFYSKRKGPGGGVALTRKPSLGGVRPFLHQYEVKGENKGVSSQPNSAPTSPIKSKESGFRRSLSFGAGIAGRKYIQKASLPHPLTLPATSQLSGGKEEESTTTTTCATPTSQVVSSNGKCVMARQLSHHQVDYLQEVREFEAEIQRHAHKYPHVAPVFHEFVQKFQGKLEEAAVGNFLPKVEGQASSLHPNTSLSLNPASTDCIPDNPAGMVSPPSAPGSGNATPSESVTPTGLPVTHAMVVPCPKQTRFGNLENVLANTTNHAHVKSIRPLCQSTGSFSVEGDPFNPNSLLVSASTNTYPLFSPVVTPSSPPFLSLPCYSISLGLSSMVAPPRVKINQPIRSLAPKPAMSEQGGSVCEENTAPKRARLE